MISIDNADTYFSSTGHVNAAVWAAFTDDQRAAAVASARRVLSRGLRREMADNEAAYAEGDTERDEYAVYEQALHMLVNGRITDASSGSPYPIAVKTSEEIKRASYYSEEALRWLGWTGAAAVRG
jgi:hypothetical protein